MAVKWVSAGVPVNESEEKAFAYIKARLTSVPEQWVAVSNLLWTVDNRRGCDEIDLLAIGPPGVRLVEVKHWTRRWIEKHPNEVRSEADKLALKAKRVGTTLRRSLASLPRVDGVIVYTAEDRLGSKTPKLPSIEGVALLALSDWNEALGVSDPPMLQTHDVQRLAAALDPRLRVPLEGSLRRLGSYINLELVSPRDQRFHRIYKGVHAERRDRVLVHLYDLSALDKAHRAATGKARREFDVLNRLQLYRWAPRVIDSFQPVPGFIGEMYFFTVLEPSAPSLAKRIDDAQWTAEGRLRFVRNAFGALAEFQSEEAARGPMVHRRLGFDTVLVAADDQVVLTGFDLTRVPTEPSVVSTSAIVAALPPSADSVVAPEVATGGLGAASAASDVYCLCAILERALSACPDRRDSRVEAALAVVGKGLNPVPQDRPSANELHASLCELVDMVEGPPPTPMAPPARFWSEGQLLQFGFSKYRVVGRLGSGGVGSAFKVIQLRLESDGRQEEVGPFVGKAAHDEQTGRAILGAYSLVRPHVARHPGLSTVYEVATEWHDNSLVALLSWVGGAPLADFSGVLPLLAEDLGEAPCEHLVLRWLRQVCDALLLLHSAGLVHGDVSPSNLIVSGSDLVLTDYDFVRKIGDHIVQPGTVAYCSPNALIGGCASAADDLFALAASFYRVLWDKGPFECSSAPEDRVNGLCLLDVEREQYPRVTRFLEAATCPHRSSYLDDTLAAVRLLDQLLSELQGTCEPQPTLKAPMPTTVKPRPEGRNEWVTEMLRSYVGSTVGNQETRGLDSDSAWETYVVTPLEDEIRERLLNRQARLVILCGNAGDGKTALMQHLAEQLGIGRHTSADRVVRTRLDNGLVLTLNFDGSASWKGRTSDQLLDDFFAPYLSGYPREDVAGLVAVNDGRLLEWLDSYSERHPGQSDPPLIEELAGYLWSEDDERPKLSDHILFLSLNDRCLVGSAVPGDIEIDTRFLDQLVDSLYGGESAPAKWRVCANCAASDYCHILEAARVFGPDSLANLGPFPLKHRRWARKRLYRALQAVHVRGRVHITMRELRGALVYVLFGADDCTQYHNGDGRLLPYWERAFSPAASSRQGEVLREMLQLDPALEVHPRIDRYLRLRRCEAGAGPSPFKDLGLCSAKRRAYFEWLPEDIEKIGGDPRALDLFEGESLDKFLELAGSTDNDRSRMELCRELCRGISHLEDLPPVVSNREGVVPLRVIPRTPTETVLWVEKPYASFRLEVPLSAPVEMVARLSREAVLVYTYKNGTEERLSMSMRLFHTLLQMAQGYQLGDMASDELFSRVEIFTRRLLREDERTLYAWTPLADESSFQIVACLEQDGGQVKQELVLQPRGEE